MAIDQPLEIAPGVFADHAASDLIHAVPDTLALASDPAGKPQLTLALHSSGAEGGGVFQARWKPVRSESPALMQVGWSLAQASSARLRVTPRTPVPDTESLSAWRNVALDGEGGALVAMHLGKHDAEIMRDLALGEANPLTLEMELRMPGVVTGYPFTAMLELPAAFDMLEASLGGSPVDHDAVIAAFLALPESSIGFRRRGSGRSPGDEALRRECAMRALQSLFVPAPDGLGLFVLADMPQGERLSIRLDLPRSAEHVIRIAWSMRDFVASLESEELRRDHFPVLDDIKAFETVEITALNQIPLDPAHLHRVRVDFEHAGRTGTPVTGTLVFEPGEPIIKRMTATWPALTHSFGLRSKVQATIAALSGIGPPFPWPRAPRFAATRDPLAVSLTTHELGLNSLEIRALDGLFDHCQSVAYWVHDGAREIVGTLRPDKPRGWIVYPASAPGPLLIKIEAHPLDHEHSSVIIRDEAVTSAPVLIGPIDVHRREPVWVEARITAPDIPYAVIDLREEGRSRITTRIVRPGEPARIAVWPDLFAPLKFEHQISIIRRDESGRTRPIATSPWISGSDPIVEIA